MILPTKNNIIILKVPTLDTGPIAIERSESLYSIMLDNMYYFMLEKMSGKM